VTGRKGTCADLKKVKEGTAFKMDHSLKSFGKSNERGVDDCSLGEGEADKLCRAKMNSSVTYTKESQLRRMAINALGAEKKFPEKGGPKTKKTACS